MNIHYIGEHLMPGMLGRTFVWISFATAILATVLYILNASGKVKSLKKVRLYARGFFMIHVFSMVSVAGHPLLPDI
jgi:hypothetical protein